MREAEMGGVDGLSGLVCPEARPHRRDLLLFLLKLLGILLLLLGFDFVDKPRRDLLQLGGADHALGGNGELADLVQHRHEVGRRKMGHDVERLVVAWPTEVESRLENVEDDLSFMLVLGEYDDAFDLVKSGQATGLVRIGVEHGQAANALVLMNGAVMLAMIGEYRE